MKNSFPYVALTLCLACSVPASAWDDCDHKADREASVSLDGVERIEVLARAGDLRIEGRKGSAQVMASGRACASSKSLLDDVQIKTERSGATLRIIAEIPETNGWKKKARLDLKIDVPSDLPLEIDDSSGDIRVIGAMVTRVDDGSGDISLEDTSGDLELEDGSGDIRVADHRGMIELEDGSGDANLKDITGSVLVRSDGSGDLRMETVSGSVEVKSDGSGDIFAGRVGGDFLVARAGSGDVRHRDVSGRVKIPTRD